MAENYGCVLRMSANLLLHTLIPENSSVMSYITSMLLLENFFLSVAESYLHSSKLHLTMWAQNI